MLRVLPDGSSLLVSVKAITPDGPLLPNVIAPYPSDVFWQYTKLFKADTWVTFSTPIPVSTALYSLKFLLFFKSYNITLLLSEINA